MERPRSPRPVSLPLEILPLQPLPLQELRLLPAGAHWRVDQWLPELESRTSVRGELRARWLGDALEVSGQASTTLTLCCDRCLVDYDHPLAFDCRELIALAAEGEENLSPEVFDLSGLVVGSLDQAPHGQGEAEGPCERLDPLGLFDPARWLFEQLSLQWPCRNHCGKACPGPAVWSTAEPEPLDPRWARLSQLR